MNERQQPAVGGVGDAEVALDAGDAIDAGDGVAVSAREAENSGVGRRIRVAVVDDDTIIREALAHLIPQLQVTIAVSSVEELLTARPEAEVVLLDLVLTGTGRTGLRQGAAAVEAVAGAGYRVLIYTNERRREVLVGCMAAGARGVIHKAEPLAALADAAAAVSDGHVVITQALVGLAELAERRGSLASLTTRQREILSARARGETFRSIAERLFISKKTAEEHMTVVTAKFADFLLDHSPADLERELGLGPGDLLDPRQGARDSGR